MTTNQECENKVALRERDEALGLVEGLHAVKRAAVAEVVAERDEARRIADALAKAWALEPPLIPRPAAHNAMNAAYTTWLARSWKENPQ